MLDIDAIKARLDAACPGPWTGMTVHRSIDGRCLAIVREHAEGERVSQDGARLTVAATLIPQLGDPATAVMLLHARADIEALLEEVERHRAALRASPADLLPVSECIAMRDAAVARERADVVAWLRDEATKPFEGGMALLYAAKRVERGDHRREES